MKKFTKKLALMLVLAMIVGMFSGVMTASAASSWSFNSGAVDSTKALAKNEYYNFNLFKDGKEVTADDAIYSVVWTSSDSEVVWINAKTGQARADKAGKMVDETGSAKISAVITNKNTKKTTTKSVNVLVGKPEVSKVLIVFEDGTDATLALEAGKEYDLATKTVNEAGTVLTFAQTGLYRAYFCEGLDIAADGKFTPVKAGTYTITAATFGSKEEAANATAPAADSIIGTLDVVVGAFQAEFVSAKLTAKNTVELVMDSAVTAEEANKVKVYRVISGNKADMSNLIKEVKLSEDGTTIKVTIYSEFVNDTKYVFELGEAAPYELTAAIGKAVAVKITEPKDNKATINQATEVKLVYVDANGLEVSKPDGSLTVKASASSYSYFDSNAMKLYMYKAGETVTLTAEFTLNEYNEDWTQKKLTGDSFVVVGVDTAAITYTDTKQFTVATTADWNKTAVEMSKSETNKSLFYRVQLSDKSYITEGWKFEALNTGVVLINAATGVIVPIGTGTATILVSSSDGKYVDVVSIIVKEDAKTTDVIVSPNGSTAASNSETLNGVVKYKVEYVDQYGKTSKVKADKITVTKVMSKPNGASDEVSDYTIDINEGEVALETSGLTKGSYSFKLEAKDITGKTYTKYFTANVTKAADTGAVAFKVVVDSTAIDNIIKKDSTLAKYSTGFKIVGIDASGAETAIVKTENADGSAYKMMVGGKEVTVYDIMFSVKKGNDAVADGNSYDAADGVGSFAGVYAVAATGASVVGGQGVKKLASAVYTIGAQVVVTEAGVSTTRDAIPANITVSDTSVAPTITVKNGIIEAGSATTIDTIEEALMTPSKVFELPKADGQGYSWEIAKVTYKTAINASNTLVSGDVFVEKVTVLKKYSDDPKNVEEFVVTLNRTIRVEVK